MTCSHAVQFANDLKLAHYTHIKPKHTFWAQITSTLVSTFIATGVVKFQMTKIAMSALPRHPFSRARVSTRSSPRRK